MSRTAKFDADRTTQRIIEWLQREGASPDDIRAVAEEILARIPVQEQEQPG